MKLLLCLASLPIITAITYKDGLTADSRPIFLSVAKIIRQHFTPGRSLFVSLPESTGNVTQNSSTEIFLNEDDLKMLGILLKEINEQTYCPVYVIRCCSHIRGTKPGDIKLYQSYIIFIHSQTHDNASLNLVRQLDHLEENVLLNNRAKFILVVTSQTAYNTSNLALKILNVSWRYKIVDVLLMIQSLSLNRNGADLPMSNEVNSPIIELFTFFPYTREQNCSDMMRVTLLDTLFINDNLDSVYKKKNLFPKRNIANLYGCPVKVITYHFPPTVVDISNSGNANCTGLEINILSFIIKSLNATVAFKIVPSTNGSFFRKYVALLAGLASGSADIAVGALPLHALLVGNSEPTDSYFQTPVQWIVPCPKATPRWGTIFRVFPLSVWLCICLCFVVVLVAMLLVASSSEHFNYTSLQYCALNVWAVVIETSVPKKPHTFRVRLIFIVWIWVSFALCVVFQTFFTTYLVNPGFERKIKTLDDLYRSEIKYGYIEQYEHVTEYTKHTKNKMKCVDLYVCLECAIKYGNFATISNAFHADYYRINLSWHDSHLPVCKLEEEIVRVNVAMYLAKGHPLLQRINQLTKTVVESGLIVKWNNDFMYSSRLHRLSDIDDNYETKEDEWDRDYFAFSLRHLRSAFLVLMIGYSLSLSAAFIELIYFKIHSRNVLCEPVRNIRTGHLKKR
jgi:hypothetical protein